MDGVLGGEEAEARAEAQETLAGADAFAAAIVAIASRQDPVVARKTEAFLDDQSALLKLQAKQLQDEHALRLASLREQVADGRFRRLATQLRIAFQLLAAVIVTAIAVVIVVAIHDAVSSNTVVVDAFDTPPALAADGVNGQVVAGGLLDEFTKIQAATRGNLVAKALAGAWTNQIQVEVPETGVSIGQIEQLLKARFGHDQHIGGDLVRTRNGGLALTVRGQGIPPKTFTDDSGDLDKLTVQAGEYAYGQSQPAIWATYLEQTGRDDEAIAFARASYPKAAVADRPFLLNVWANAIANEGGPGAMQKALVLWRETVRMQPDFWTGHNNIMYGLNGLGDEEGIILVGRQMIKAAGGRPGKAPETFYVNYDQLIYDLGRAKADNLDDLRAHSGVGTTSDLFGAGDQLGIAQADAQMHDVAAAQLELQTVVVDPKDFGDQLIEAWDRADIAEEKLDFAAAALAWDDAAKAFADPGARTANPNGMCFAQVDYERAGQPTKADAAFASRGSMNFVDCYRLRGDMLDLRGDWAGAQALYAAAVKLVPDSPAGYYSWGMALARHGDLAGAAVKLAIANEKGPGWADPLKAWGDVLARQGQWKAALTKYDLALQRASAWPALKQARAQAAARAG